MRGLRLWLVAITLVSAPATAAELETTAKQAFMIEAESGTVLLSKEPDTPIQPASLVKLMTAEVVFDAVTNGKARLDDLYKVSELAWRTGGAPARTTTMFAVPNSSVRLEDLLKGVVITSANDGAIAIAEGMAGTEAKFSDLMNQRAAAIGLKHSAFRNPTGALADGQQVTMRDLVSLSQHLHKTYPDFYKLYSVTHFEWNKIRQPNRNPLLGIPGVDGLATGGAVETGGFTFVGSAQRGEQRLFLALGGLPSDRERSAEARRLVEWGLTAFDRAPLFARDAVIGQARVFGGEKQTVDLKASGPVSIFVAAEDKAKLSARITYKGPIPAPVAAGQVVGSLQISLDDKIAQETPLLAAEDVALGSIASRAKNAVGELVFGWMR